MAEIWAAAGAVATVAGGVLSGRAASKKDKSDKKFGAAEERALARDEAKYGAIATLFDAQVSDYYSQLNRQRKQRGLDQFRNFSTVNKFIPGYAEQGRIDTPVMPTVADVNAMVDQSVMSQPTKV